MSLRYIIRYEWPNGKIRYRSGTRLCVDEEDADIFTLIEASRILKQSKDARIVWDIKTTKVKV